ncbi:efflux RND transporter periplasmic adaptor subunit [Donghicola sp. C2-DW-16]|uniref:Efflux RND transporter periplasmic adaptor subunit n=1 Tax=Donghicola mangrovi TaxID=2729614 RepID=A0ABX2PIS5_9RHOB|nr:efflux RND transporter periplasmic adaptor subunit [Donghicola mangrovi]NVO28996.1 efflux RND transporter periplasmic adaptor subunit [Donghicola mangrovi]
MSKRTLLVTALLLAGAAGAAWVYYDKGTEATAALPATVSAGRGDVESTVLATGLIEAKSLVSVGARTSGQIEELLVKVGDEVTSGALIAQIDSLEQQNALKQAEADLAQIEAEIASNAAEIKLAELNLARISKLSGSKLSTADDLNSAEAALAVARAASDSLAAQKSRAEVEVAAAQLDLDRTRITAPMDGTVVAVVSDEGTTLNASTESPTIVKLAALDRMEIKAEISEADVVNVHAGQAVRFSLLGATDVEYDAVLDAVEPAPSSIADSDEVSTDEAIYYNARFMVDNPDRILRIGMSANVTVVLDSVKDAVTLPLSALPERAEADGRYALPVMDASGKPALRMVEVGVRGATDVQILSGLEDGDQVVAAAGLPVDVPSAQMGAGGPPPGMGF